MKNSSPVTLPAARRHSERFSLSSRVDPLLLHRTQKLTQKQKLLHVPLVLLKLALKFSWGPKNKQLKIKDKTAPSQEKHGMVKRGCGVRR